MGGIERAPAQGIQHASAGPMCGTASWRSRKTKRYCRGCFSTALTKDRDLEAQLSEDVFFLAALELPSTGDFAEAIRLSSEILAGRRGHIYPATMSSVELEASFEDGNEVRGETKITASKGKGKDSGVGFGAS